MPLESTMICVDNSEYMRNGDYVPTRLQAQQDAVNTVCRYKLLANPENNVGLLTLADTEVLATLTTDAGKILTSLHRVQPSGFINLLTGIRIAHLALKHRQSKNHKMRIVVFVGSPIQVDEKEAGKIAKRLKKENVNIDIVNFGETDDNQSCLEVLINTINGREGTGSHLVTIPPSPHLSDALMSSPIIQGEDGSGPTNFGSGGGFEFGVDPNEDPELALALRVSMEEQRQRQLEEERRVAVESKTAEITTTSASTTAATPTTTTTTTATPAAVTGTVSSAKTPTTPASGISEEEMLRQALAMSLETGMSGTSDSSSTPTPAPVAPATSGGFPDFSSMTEEEQIAYAMQISLQGCQSKEAPEPMDVDKKPTPDEKKEKEDVKMDSDSEYAHDPEDFKDVINDPAFLANVLQSLPGVNPQSQVVKEVVGSLTGLDKKDKDKKSEEKEEEDKDKDKDKDRKDKQ